MAVGARTPKISASGVTAVVGATATQLHLALQQRHIELEQLRRELQHERALWMRNQQQEEDQLHEQLACVLKVGLGDGPSAASMTTAPTAEGVALPKGQVAETVTLLMKLFGRLVEGEAMGEVPHRALATEAEGVLHAAVQQLQWAEHLAKNAPRKGELDASLHELYSERAKLMAALRTSLEDTCHAHDLLSLTNSLPNWPAKARPMARVSLVLQQLAASFHTEEKKTSGIVTCGL